jgi:hypothetical protein
MGDTGTPIRDNQDQSPGIGIDYWGMFGVPVYVYDWVIEKPVAPQLPTLADLPWGTLDQANAFFANRPEQGLWTGCTLQGAYLAWAQRDILSCNDYLFPVDANNFIVPTDAMIMAVCEQALFRLIDPDVDARMAAQAQNIGDAGLVQERYRLSIGQVPICFAAKSLLQNYLKPHYRTFEVIR